VDCENLWPGGFLASVETECENDFLSNMAGSAAPTWIGGADGTDRAAAEGTFKWIKTGGANFFTGGNPIPGQYTNFASNQPNNGGSGQHCLAMQGDGEWDDQLCTKAQQHICETAATVGGNALTQPTTTKASTRACAGTCASGWLEMDCQCYQIVTDKKTWTDAKAHCKTLNAGASLISLTSKTVEDKMMELLNAPPTGTETDKNEIEFWTGGNDFDSPDTEFKWDLTGQVFWRRDTSSSDKFCCAVDGVYNHWYFNGQPNHANLQNCIKTKYKIENGAITRAGWDDSNCAGTFKSACQYSVLS